MSSSYFKGRTAPLIAVSATIMMMAGSLMAQPPAGRGGRGGRGGAPRTAEQQEPEDLTGYWVSIVTEDWRYRMVTPAKGDYASVPLNAEGRRVADTWDPAKDEASGNACKSYGAPGVMRVPGRVHITWQDPETMKVETDAGTQTRVFHFGGTMPAGMAPSWQGYSEASWEMPPPGRGGRGQAAPPPPAEPVGAQNQRAGSLKVITTDLKPGYIRKNGVPYSANAKVTEYYSRTNEPNGDSWLIVTTIVDDPMYLAQPFITSTHFKHQADATGWAPSACEAK
jgi:hypothetical protein